MTTERPQDELNAAPILLVGVVSAILLFATIVGLTAVFLGAEEGETESKANVGAPGELRRLTSDQMEELAEYKWLDQEKGVVRIPIDRAIDLVLKEAAEKENR